MTEDLKTAYCELLLFSPPHTHFTGTLGEESKQFCSHQLTGSCFGASLPSPPVNRCLSDCQSRMKKPLSDSSFLKRGILSTAQSRCIHSPETSTTGRHLDHSCSVREHGINHRCSQRLMSSSSARGLFLCRLSSRRQKMALLPVFFFFYPPVIGKGRSQTLVTRYSYQAGNWAGTAAGDLES